MKYTKCIVCNAKEKRQYCFNKAKSIKRLLLNFSQNFDRKLQESLDTRKINIHKCYNYMPFMLQKIDLRPFHRVYCNLERLRNYVVESV